jgi:hypothetical protein
MTYGSRRAAPASIETCRHVTTHEKRCPWRDRCDAQRRVDEAGSPWRQDIVPPLASARIIDLQAARLALGRDSERAPPASLGGVPLSFRQWHGDLVQLAPRFRREAWAAAAAIHALVGGAILLYASFATLPPPLPGIAVTLSFEPAKPAGEPSPAPPTETATPEAATPETPPVETPPAPEA